MNCTGTTSQARQTVAHPGASAPNPATPAQLAAAGQAARRYGAAAQRAAQALLCRDARPDADRLHHGQRALHGLAWIATTVEAIAQGATWGERLAQAGGLAEIDVLMLQVGLAEYLAQLASGIPMSQNEVFRPAELGLQDAAAALACDPAVQSLLATGAAPQARSSLVRALRGGARCNETSIDPELDMVRDQFRRFTVQQITPHAHQWHLADALIPDTP